MSSPTNRYTPPIPSPLNPSKPETHHPLSSTGRRSLSGSGGSSRVLFALGRKPGAPLSPTQRLLRQKAAVARRSMALRSKVDDHRVVAATTTTTTTTTTTGDNGPPPSTTTTPPTTAAAAEDSAERAPSVVDLEKQPIFADEKGILKGEVDFLGEEPPEPRRNRTWCSGVVTIRRMVVVAALVCTVGTWTVVHMTGHAGGGSIK